MSPLGEVGIARRQLAAFIKADGFKIRLNRPQKAQTLSGGRRKTADLVLPPQLFRIIPFKRRLIIEYGFSAQGEQVKNVPYILEGLHSADVEPGDWFRLEGNYYEVKFVSKRQVDRTAAGLITRDA